MSIFVRKLIYDVDFIDTYRHMDSEYPDIKEFSSIDEAIKEIPNDGLMNDYSMSLIDGNTIHKHINLDQYGIYFLSLRPNFLLEEIEIEPEGITLHLQLGVENEPNRMVYIFYNPIPDVRLIKLKAKVWRNAFEMFKEIHRHKEDKIWWNYFLLKIQKRQPNSAAKNLRKDAEWMNADEAAAYLGLAVKTIRNRTASKKIPFTKKDGLVRYSKSDLDDWLGKNKITPKPNKRK